MRLLIEESTVLSLIEFHQQNKNVYSLFLVVKFCIRFFNGTKCLEPSLINHNNLLQLKERVQLHIQEHAQNFLKKSDLGWANRKLLFINLSWN